MTTVLIVNASARTSRSLTRQLSQAFEHGWRHRFPLGRVIHRDVGREPPGFISESWVEAAFTPDGSRTFGQRHMLSESDRLIGEVQQADVIVIATPMYNYGMPASLKAWLDNVIRIDRTFDFDLRRGDYPLRPTMTGKTLVMLTSSGEFGFEAGGERERSSHLVPHLRTVSRYLGVVDDYHVGIEYQEFGDERHEHSKATAFSEISVLVDSVEQNLSQHLGVGSWG